MNDIKTILEELKKGKPFILVDDEHRENEGDFIFPAQTITPEIVNIMIGGRGLLCVAITSEIANKYGLTLIDNDNSRKFNTAFTQSVDARDGLITTGISASDRATTIKLLGDVNSNSSDILKSGHIFPMIAEPQGVLARAGHTEASVDFSRLAGYSSCAATCEILKKDGSLARVPDLLKLCDKLDIKIASIEDLVLYRIKNEDFITLDKDSGDNRFIINNKFDNNIFQLHCKNKDNFFSKIALIEHDKWLELDEQCSEDIVFSIHKDNLFFSYIVLLKTLIKLNINNIIFSDIEPNILKIFIKSGINARIES